MSKEILFRAKRVDNGEWVEGYYGKKQRRCTSPHAPIMFDVYFIVKETVLEDYSYFEDIEVLPETVGEFTGLYDSTKWEQLGEAEK